jgi:hypothetical protein
MIQKGSPKDIPNHSIHITIRLPNHLISRGSQTSLNCELTIPNAIEQDTLPIATLVSEQAVPYRTRGGIGFSRVSTPKN